MASLRNTTEETRAPCNERKRARLHLWLDAVLDNGADSRLDGRVLVDVNIRDGTIGKIIRALIYPEDE